MSEEYSRNVSLGFSCLDESRPAAAASAFRRAVLWSPAEMIALYGVGFAELRQKKISTSKCLLSRAWKVARRNSTARLLAETLLALAHCLRSEGDHSRAELCLRRAAIVEPGNGQIHAHRSSSLTGTPRQRSARWAVTASPGTADYWNQIGLAWLNSESPNICDSARLYRRALVLNPAHHHAWSNLGIANKHADELRLAVRCFARARVGEPGNGEVLLNLGRNLLLTGAFTEGWKRLEEPWRALGLQPRAGGFSLPLWDGARLGGARLLLWSEEKVGEEIMFSSLLRDVERKAGPVTLLCDPRIAGLLERALPNTLVRGWNQGTPPPIRLEDHAACYPLEFVGRFVRRSFSDFPRPTPILRANIIRRSGTGNPRVGVHWRSVNPLVGDWKSIPLEIWKPILSVPDVEFVSLQYGPVGEEIAAVRRQTGAAPSIPGGIDQLTDIEAFTDFVAELDLVICVSSTTAHVAGSLGRPTWVMLPRGPGLSWFWFENRADSPWYPHCRLYRQVRSGEWSPVLKNVARDLVIWRRQLE